MTSLNAARCKNCNTRKDEHTWNGDACEKFAWPSEQINPRSIWRHKDHDREIVVTQVVNGVVYYEWIATRDEGSNTIERFHRRFELVED